METLWASPSAPAHFPVQPPSVGTSPPQVQSPLLFTVSANLFRLIYPLGLGGLSLALLTKPIHQDLVFSSFHTNLEVFP